MNKLSNYIHSWICVVTFIKTHSFLQIKICIFAFSSTIKGLMFKLWGNIGKRQIAFAAGWIIGPFAESEYAVEPVGVEIIIPSAF